MSKEVGISEATGEPTNASAARGTTPTLVVRRPDDGSRPEIPVMTVRSHSRGGRSSACAQEPSSQAGSYPTENESLGDHPTRQDKSGPEPEIHPNLTNYPTDPTSVGTGLNPPPPETNNTTISPHPPVFTSHHHTEQVHTGPHPPVFTGTQVFTSLRQCPLVLCSLLYRWKNFSRFIFSFPVIILYASIRSPRSRRI